MSATSMKPGSLGVIIASSLALTLIAGSMLADLNSDLTTLTADEAQKVVGGQASCTTSGWVALEVLSEGCSSGCTPRRNATYTTNNTGTRGTISNSPCQNGLGAGCGTRLVALGVCAT